MVCVYQQFCFCLDISVSASKSQVRSIWFVLPLLFSLLLLMNRFLLRMFRPDAPQTKDLLQMQVRSQSAVRYVECHLSLEYMRRYIYES